MDSTKYVYMLECLCCMPLSWLAHLLADAQLVAQHMMLVLSQHSALHDQILQAPLEALTRLTCDKQIRCATECVQCHNALHWIIQSSMLPQKRTKCSQATSKSGVRQNVLVGNADVGQLKLCDFGFARPLPANNGSITDYVSTR